MNVIDHSREQLTRARAEAAPVELVAEPVAPAMDTGQVVQMRVKVVGDDTLTCRRFDGTSESGPSIVVAKAHTHRKTGWHGQTINGETFSYTGGQSRTADDGSAVQNEAIVPPWIDDFSVIFAGYVTAGTGIESGGEAVRWIDLNVDGRAWGKVS